MTPPAETLPKDEITQLQNQLVVVREASVAIEGLIKPIVAASIEALAEIQPLAVGNDNELRRRWPLGDEHILLDGFQKQFTSRDRVTATERPSPFFEGSIRYPVLSIAYNPHGASIQGIVHNEDKPPVAIKFMEDILKWSEGMGARGQEVLVEAHIPSFNEGGPQLNVYANTSPAHAHFARRVRGESSFSQGNESAETQRAVWLHSGNIESESIASVILSASAEISDRILPKLAT